MPQEQRPQVTVSGSALRPPADVIGSGTDEQRPPPRGLRALVAVALGAVLLGAVLVDGADDTSPAGERDAAPADEDLRLVETDGALSLSWGYGGRLDISLPVLIHNDGTDMTVSSLALDGTALEQPAVDVALSKGGRLPLTLRQSMNCPEGAAVPANAALRLSVRQNGVGDTRWLPLPEGTADALASALSEQCSAVPLEQSVVVTAEEVDVRAEGVVLRVVAENISTEPLQLVSVDPATGLGVTLATGPGDPVEALPHVLTGEPVVLRLAVDVHDCTVLTFGDRLETLGVADIAYTDASGRRSAEVVIGDFPRLRKLVERTC